MECLTDPANLLLPAYKERNVSHKLDQIQSAFPGCNPEDRYAARTSDHLLSREELALYSKLEASGDLRNIIGNTDLDATRPLLDEDIQSAIESLNASTAAVGKQAEALMSQFHCFGKFFHLEDDRWASSSDLACLQKKHAVGLQNVSAKASDLTRDLEGCLKRESDNANVESKRVLSWLACQLKEDDRKLTSLEALASEIKSPGNGHSSMKKASQLSAALVEYAADEVYCRLDRLYLDIVQTSNLTSDDMRINKDGAVATLEENLESLYFEIDILAQMSTNQQFNVPILREIQNQRGQERNASHRILRYVLDMLIEISSAAEGFARSLQNRHSFYETLRFLRTIYQTVTHVQSSEPPSSWRDGTQRCSTQKGLLCSGKKSNSHLTEPQALKSLFRRICLSSELVSLPEEAGESARSLYEKKLHMRDSIRNPGVAANSTLVPELTCTDSANQLLLSSLNSNSHFESTLSNLNQGKRLSIFESQLGSIQRSTASVNLSVLYQRDRNQKRFIETWG